MYKKIRSFPAHIFLIPLFFILHKLNDFFSLIPAPVILKYTVLYICLSAILLLLARLFVFRSLTRSGLMVTAFLIIFYFFGATHDLLKKAAVPSWLVSYKLLLSVIGAIVVSVIVYLKRSMLEFTRTQTYFNILFGFLVVVESGIFLFKTFNHAEKNNDFARYNLPVIKDSLNGHFEKPDIFFIVFDEYASTLNLRKYLHYDNALNDSLLRSNNFYVAANAQSNYNVTQYSLATTFNLAPFNVPTEQLRSTPRTYLQGWYSLKHSSLPRVLQNNGYTIYNYGLCDLESSQVQTSEYFNEYQERALYEETLWGRIEKDILWNVTTGSNPLGNYLNKRRSLYNQEYVSRNIKNMQLTIDELNSESNQPRFVYSHAMMPHAPFLLDRNGNFLSQGQYTGSSEEDLYIEQLIYCNAWIKKLAIAANKKTRRPRIVIIEGDHGYRDLVRNMPRESYFMNLSAIYFSDKDYRNLYDSISPVNYFRIIFNKYFNTQFPVIKDSTFFIR